MAGSDENGIIRTADSAVNMALQHPTPYGIYNTPICNVPVMVEGKQVATSAFIVGGTGARECSVSNSDAPLPPLGYINFETATEFLTSHNMRHGIASAIPDQQASDDRAVMHAGLINNKGEAVGVGLMAGGLTLLHSVASTPHPAAWTLGLCGGLLMIAGGAVAFLVSDEKSWWH